MKTIRRLFVIIAFVLIIGGIGLVTIYGIKTGFKFKEELVTNTHENLASYESMDLDKIIVILSQDEEKDPKVKEYIVNDDEITITFQEGINMRKIASIIENAN